MFRPASQAIGSREPGHQGCANRRCDPEPELASAPVRDAEAGCPQTGRDSRATNNHIQRTPWREHTKEKELPDDEEPC